MKNLAVILLLLKVFSLVKATEFTDEYDITTALNNTIVKIFQTVEPQNIANVFHRIVNFDDVDLSTTPYKYNFTWMDGDKDTSNFYNLRITNASPNNPCASYAFFDNQLNLYSPQFVVELSGRMKLDACYTRDIFNLVLYFIGCTIRASRKSKVSVQSFLVDIQYNCLNIENYCKLNKWPSFWINLEQNLQSILRTHMNRNAKLLHVMGELYDNLNQSLERINSNRPHFLGHEHLHYYLIPNLPFGSLNLKNIVVKGLWNFYSLNSTINSYYTFTYTLLIKDIRGSMILEDESQTKSLILGLNYFVDSLSIFVTQVINRISVKAENYSIIEIKSNTSLTKVQSDILMDQVERAIGSSLMPSMEFKGTKRTSNFSSRREMENSLRRLLTEKSVQSNEKNIQHPHTTRRSIDDKNLPTNSPPTIINNYNINNYQISFPNLTITYFISGNQSHPEQIQCPLLDNSQFSHRINVAPSGKLLRNDDRANSTHINFNFNSPSLNVSIINQNNSKTNDSCGFQISNDQYIKVRLPSENTTRGSNKELLEIKNKIDMTLMSMAKERIVQAVKSMACFPFEVCAQSAKLVNEFFLRFVDEVLRKCSFERPTTAPNQQSEEFLDP